jgi:nicotinate-nucleotide adenylyltransferase
LKRIGLFGGTFNPIHKGHLRAAAAVREGFGLDTVDLIPSAVPPHKASKDIAPAHHRLEMVRLAAAGLENMLVSDVELVRSGPSYTIDTVHHFRRKFDDDAKLFFIVGTDAFLEIDTWKNFEDLLRSISLIVMDRPAGVRGPRDSFFETIRAFLGERISGEYIPGEDSLSFFHPRRPSIHIFSGEMVDVSSTRIRQCITRGEDVSSGLSPSVKDYIQRKGIYR